MVRATDVRRSFDNVRKDILNLNQRILDLQYELDALKGKKTTVVRTDKVSYIASKAGTIAHAEGSIHANNIKKDNRVYFPNKQSALKAGYKVK